MQNKKIKLRAWFPLAIPFQGIEMDNDSVSVRENGSTIIIMFDDILSIKVQGFKLNLQEFATSWVKDIVIVSKSGKETGLFNCKKRLADVLIERIKTKNPSVAIDILEELWGGTKINGVRLARDPMIYAYKNTSAGWYIRTIGALLIIIVVTLIVFQFARPSAF